MAVTPLDPRELAPKVQGLHAMLATITRQPVFMLETGEAMMMAEAIAELSKFYNLNLMSGKYAAWINLAVVSGMIYLPRLGAIKNSRRMVAPTAPATPDEMAMADVNQATMNFEGSPTLGDTIQ